MSKDELNTILRHLKDNATLQYTIGSEKRDRRPLAACLSPLYIIHVDSHSFSHFFIQAQTLRVKSQEPVDMEVPSGDVLRQDTLFSWP